MSVSPSSQFIQAKGNDRTGARLQIDSPPPLLRAAGLIVPEPSVMFLEPLGTVEDCGDGE